ncbi:MAG: 2-oxoacid:acceptor oxidoreductase family protein [Deltaproteobacteria bacterium]|nr:2-oxoacid:acceptor oxidoreductase family protein [Deltaproteobacteria bacterium]
MSKIKYQIVATGFGGQGTVFLVKLLSICALHNGVECLGTENHGMSQRGGTVVTDIKIGDFYTPVISLAQANLMIGLHPEEALRVVQYLSPSGAIVVNAGKDFPKLNHPTYRLDAFHLAEKGVFNIQALNIFMLGFAISHVSDFPFSVREIEGAIYEINPKIAPMNLEVFHLGLSQSP